MRRQTMAGLGAGVKTKMGDFGCWDIRGKFVITVDHDTVADKTEHKVKGGQVKETFKRWGDMKVKP